MTIRGTSGPSSNPLPASNSYLDYLKSRPKSTAFAAGSKHSITWQAGNSTASPRPSAHNSRAARFVEQLNVAIHDALRGLTPGESNDPEADLSSSIERAIRTSLQIDENDYSQLLRPGKHHHYVGHGGGGPAGAAMSALARTSGGRGSSARHRSTTVTTPSRRRVDSRMSHLHVDQSFKGHVLGPLEIDDRKHGSVQDSSAGPRPARERAGVKTCFRPVFARSSCLPAIL